MPVSRAHLNRVVHVVPSQSLGSGRNGPCITVKEGTKEVVDMSKIKLTKSKCPKCGAVYKAETKRLGLSSTQQKTKNKPIVFVLCQDCLDAITPIGSQADASTRA
jgi:uncharacterized protein YlaI